MFYKRKSTDKRKSLKRGKNTLPPQSENLPLLRGIALLRLACALFSLIPAVFNIIAPQDFLALLPIHSPYYAELKQAFEISVWVQLACSLFILIGFNVRFFVLPMILFVLPVQGYFVSFDELSSLREISLAGFLMVIGLHGALFFLGNGGFAVQKSDGIIGWLAGWDSGSLRRLLYMACSPSARNIGIILVRLSAALPLAAAAIMGLALENPKFLSPYHELNMLFGLSAFLVSASLLSGFKIRHLVWPVFILLALNLAFVAIPEAAISQIGVINIEFHVLLMVALYIARFLALGSVMERQHILNADKQKIVIIGGGFAGTSLARRLEGIIASDYQVVLVSEENYTTFNPMLAEVVGASVMPSHVLAPIRRMLRRTVFIMGQAIAHDCAKKTITCRTPKGKRVIKYKHLVFAMGSRANLDLMPGMNKYAYPLKMLGDALVLRNRVIEQLEKLDREGSDADGTGAHAGVFVVVGGGFSGIEVAGALQDYLLESVQFYPRIRPEQLKVIVVHSGDLPLPELPQELGAHSLAAMQKHGIEFHLQARVKEARSDGIILQDGKKIKGDTIICTIGTRPNPLVNVCGDLSQERGRFVVNADMRIKGRKNIWAIGDCAFIPNMAEGNALSPPTAQFAVAQGKQAAYNIRSALLGGKTRPFSMQSKGMMAVIGHLNGVALVHGVKISGFAGWLLWRMFYLMLMPTYAKKTRIAFEWLWSMLFSPDIVNLRFTRTQDADKS